LRARRRETLLVADQRKMAREMTSPQYLAVLGSRCPHVPVCGAIFNKLGGSFVPEKCTIARNEPALPAKLLILKKLKLAERVGFEPDRTL
jgi:hypothetical protein